MQDEPQTGGLADPRDSATAPLSHNNTIEPHVPPDEKLPEDVAGDSLVSRIAAEGAGDDADQAGDARPQGGNTSGSQGP